MSIEEHDKTAVYDLLTKYKGALRSHLRNAPDLIKSIDAKARETKAGKKGNVPWEGTLIDEWLLPVLHEQVRGILNQDAELAKAAIVAESGAVRGLIASASMSAIRVARHPFGKRIGTSVDAIAAAWKGDHGKAGNGFSQACPDFAMRNPYHARVQDGAFPYKVVFEAKYFREGSAEKGRRALVENLYQAFFYLGLPYCAGDAKHAAWDYDYACLVAVDSSKQHTLCKAWQQLRDDVKRSFWKGANLFVIVISA